MFWNRSPFAKKAVSRLNPNAETFAPKMLDFSTAAEEFVPEALSSTIDSQELNDSCELNPDI
jgi:hypothetical protein